MKCKVQFLFEIMEGTVNARTCTTTLPFRKVDRVKSAVHPSVKEPERAVKVRRGMGKEVFCTDCGMEFPVQLLFRALNSTVNFTRCIATVFHCPADSEERTFYG